MNMHGLNNREAHGTLRNVIIIIGGMPKEGMLRQDIAGKYTLLDKDNPNVYAYTRELDGKKILVLLNFKSKMAIANTGIDMCNAKVMITNYATPFAIGTLQPYEAVIYSLQG